MFQSLVGRDAFSFQHLGRRFVLAPRPSTVDAPSAWTRIDEAFEAIEILEAAFRHKPRRFASHLRQLLPKTHPCPDADDERGWIAWIRDEAFRGISPLRLFEAPYARHATLPRVESTEPIDDTPAEQPLDWIELVLTHRDGTPRSGETYELTLSDGERITGTTDSAGRARHDDITAGITRIRFPDVPLEEMQDPWQQTGA
ncbi:MAG: hypothetical protein AAF799_20535 [Myxococcota bacterium]